MDMEFWTDLSTAISDVEQRWLSSARDTHPTSRIVRVHLWSTLRDRPTCWGCDKRNWVQAACPKALPNQCTMSRRMKRSDFDRFLQCVGHRLNGGGPQALKNVLVQLRIVDGKALELPNHTTDCDAKWGRGASRVSVGYKLHVIWSATQRPMPDAFVITSLNRCEKRMAGRMIKRVKGHGYLLGDAHFDASWLFDRCKKHGHQLLCPRAKPNTGRGGHYQSPDRLRAIDLLEPPANLNDFGPSLYRHRTIIERRHAAMVSFGGGIAITLPSWVRRIWRVRRWITAKLLINAARIRIKQRVDA